MIENESIPIRSIRNIILILSNGHFWAWTVIGPSLSRPCNKFPKRGAENLPRIFLSNQCNQGFLQLVCVYKAALSLVLYTIQSPPNSEQSKQLLPNTNHQPKMEQTFIMIKPDGVQRGLVMILSWFLINFFTVCTVNFVALVQSISLNYSNRIWFQFVCLQIFTLQLSSMVIVMYMVFDCW